MGGTAPSCVPASRGTVDARILARNGRTVWPPGKIFAS